jgi:hypothetical protein
VEEPPPPHPRRPRVQGQPLASPPAVVAHTAKRPHLRVAWEGGTTRDSEVVTGPGPCYRLGEARVAGRGVDVPEWIGTHRDEDFLTTAMPMKPPQSGACYPPRWASETTFQDCREYLKLESPTGDGQPTVRRCTPCLFGLYPRVVRLSLQLSRPASPLRTVFWRGTSPGPLSEMMTGVRRA